MYVIRFAFHSRISQQKEIQKRNTVKKKTLFGICVEQQYIFKLLFFNYINITNSYSNFQQIQILSLQMKLTPPPSLPLDYVCIYVICKNAIILKCTCTCTFQEIAKRKYSKYSKLKTFYFCYIIKKEYKLTTNSLKRILTRTSGSIDNLSALGHIYLLSSYIDIADKAWLMQVQYRVSSYNPRTISKLLCLCPYTHRE